MWEITSILGGYPAAWNHNFNLFGVSLTKPCSYLEGEITAPRGRKPMVIADHRLRQMILRHYYKRYLGWLKRRKARYGCLDGWSPMRQADWWQGPPNERAARMVAHRWLSGVESWRRVHNVISSRI